MLQVKNLTITHKKDLRMILEDVSLVLNAGDKAVLIGEEGNGKSTLMKWIVDPGMVESYAEAQGERILTREKLAYLPQELPEAEKPKTVYEFFAEAESFFEKSPRELAVLAKDFGMDADFFYREQTMDTLSGGERVKAELMRLLIGEPTALLLDEPSNDIDIETLLQLEKLINSFKGIVLYISHDETLIENTANMIVHIEQVRRKTKSRVSMVRMPYREYVAERQRLFDRQEQQALSDRREKKLRDEKFRRIQTKVEANLTDPSHEMHDALGRLAKKKMHVVKSLERRFEREDAEMTEIPDYEEAIFFKLGGKESSVPAGKTVIELEIPQLTVGGGSSADRKLQTAVMGAADAEDDGAGSAVGPDLAGTASCVLARNIFLRVRGPEKICIIGKNGAGKTTLLRKIAEELLARTDVHAEYMPQNYEELLDLAALPEEFLDASGEKEVRTRIRTYLGAMKFTPDEMLHPISELSGGQKAKLLLLKLSLSGANVLILDEPTRNFSPLSGPVIRRLLADFPGAILSVSHDRKFIREVCDTVLELQETGLRKVEKEELGG